MEDASSAESVMDKNLKTKETLPSRQKSSEALISLRSQNSTDNIHFMHKYEAIRHSLWTAPPGLQQQGSETHCCLRLCNLKDRASSMFMC